nr:hypothetical protein [Armatimonas sp.]
MFVSHKQSPGLENQTLQAGAFWGLGGAGDLDVFVAFPVAGLSDGVDAVEVSGEGEGGLVGGWTMADFVVGDMDYGVGVGDDGEAVGLLGVVPVFLGAHGRGVG